MNAQIASDRRQRALAELGLVSYRLRAPERDAAANTGSGAPPSVRLRVAVPDASAPPGAGPAAAIWAQVLAWLGYAGDEVGWRPGEDGVIVLPPIASWTTPEGKRGLWRALKHQAKGCR